MITFAACLARFFIALVVRTAAAQNPKARVFRERIVDDHVRGLSRAILHRARGTYGSRPEPARYVDRSRGECPLEIRVLAPVDDP
jgi:hypothetical protein